MNELSLQELVMINGGTDGCDGNHEESAAYKAGVVFGEFIQGLGDVIDAISPLI